jgi:hypothetical protein
VVAVGAERQAEAFGGQLLGGRRLEEGGGQGPVQPLVPGVGPQLLGGLAEQPLEGGGGGRGAARRLGGQPRAQQRVGGQGGRAGVVAQGLADGRLELGLGQDQQRRRQLGLQGLHPLVGELALGHAVQPGQRRLGPPVVGVDRVVAAADLEVGLGGPALVEVGHDRVPGVRVRHGEEAPGQPGVGQPLQGPGGGQQVPGRPRALVAVGAHPEAAVDQLLAGPGGAVAVGEPAGRGRGRVRLQVARVGPVQGQAGDEADQLAVGAAEGGEGLGLPPPPVLGDPGRGLPLVAPDHGEHGLTVLWAGRLHMGGAQRLPVEHGPHDRVVAVQVQQVEEGLLALQASRLPEVADDEAADSAVQLQVALGVAPAQVGVEHLAGQVVGEQPIGALLDEGEAAQPAEQLVGVVGAQGRGQQRLGHHPDMGAGLQGLAVAGPGELLHEPAQQRPDHVRALLGGQGGRVAAGGGDVGDQRQGQGVAVGERQHGRVLGGRDAAGAEVGQALGRAQVA